MKKSMGAKVMATAMAVLVAGNLLTACGSNPAGNQPGNSPSATPSAAATTPAGGEAVDLSLPIAKEKITLEYFCNINGAMSATMSTYNEVEAFKKFEELTNIHIEWIHPTGGNEQFALMVASGDLPDMINWVFESAKGGAEALLRDSIIIPITDQDLSTYMPNYMKIMAENEAFFQSTKLDNGINFRVANFNYNPDTMKVEEFQIKGPYMRLDWVEKVGKSAPTTIDEMYDVLTAIRDQKPNGKSDIIPFADDKSLTATKALAGSFGTRQNMHMRDGAVVYGPITPEYRAYLETMNKWYGEGLINSDFAVLESRDAKILNEDAASTIGSMGSGLTMQREALIEKNPQANLDSIPYLVGPDGYQSLIDDKNKNMRSTAITSSNKYPEETMRWLDYFYSEEGSLLATYGIEGESYEMKDGKPMLTDLVMNNTQGYSQEEAIARYGLGPINFPYARHIGFYEQVNLNTDQKVLIQTNWKTGDSKILMPPNTLTAEESNQYAILMADIQTYVDEMTLKFIIGQEPLSNFDKFVDSIKNMNIEKAVKIQQDSVDRYNSR